MALLAGSPAIDTGDNDLAVDVNSQPLTTDQRGVGFPRIANNIVDIGAYESNPLGVGTQPASATIDNGQTDILSVTPSNGLPRP